MRLPLLVIVGIALPLSLWASPLPREVSGPRFFVLAASAALYLGLAASGTARRRHRAVTWRLRGYLAWGAGTALFHDRFAANELAGVLVLFLPLTLALLLSPGLDGRRPPRSRRRRVPPCQLWRFELLLLTALFATLLVRTRSRGALLAALFATALVLALSGRRGRWLLAVGGGAGTALAVLFRDRLVETLVFSGSVQGLSASIVLSGRPRIWDRALLALGDFPVTGVGLGTFGPVAQGLYFPRLAAPAEDAHNLYLQTALDLGLPGLVAFLAWLGAVARHGTAAISGATRPGLRRSRRIGLAAALAAHLVYSLTDAVALGTPGSVTLFLLCGLIAAEDAAPPPRYRHRRRAALAAAALLAAGAVSPTGRSWLRLNRATVVASKALVADPAHLADPVRLEEAAAALEEVPLCRAGWLRGLVAQRQGQAVQSAAAWRDLVSCSSEYFDLLEQVAGRNRRLAEHAAATRPEDGRGHLYLARVLVGLGEDGDREAAADAYRRSVALDPGSAQAWLELADLLAPSDGRESLAAYVEACRRGDPGANACYRGGQQAETLGEIDTAIALYRRSRWYVARQRAAEIDRP